MTRLVLLVGAGSCIGGIARYLLSTAIAARAGTLFPYATLVVNIVGCLVIGLVLGWNEKAVLSTEWKLFLATGICGGFTTFSAFSYETLVLMRDGQIVSALVYAGTSMLLGLSATWLGFYCMK